MNIRSIKLSLILLLSISFGCKKDNFTDPDDPKFGSEAVGLKLNFDATSQTISHFGASGGFQDQWVGKWPDASKDPIAKLLFSTKEDDQGNPEGIGLSLWRTIIGDGAADQYDSGFKPGSWFRETECYLNADGQYDWTKQSGEQWFLKKAKEYGVDQFTAWATTPPYFMTKNGYTFRTTGGPSGFNCKADKQKVYSDFLAEVVKHYEDEGYNFLTVCAFNETQYGWNAKVGEAGQSGTTATNAEIAKVSKLFDKSLIDKGVQAKMMIPEAGQLKYLYEGTQNTTNQVDDFFDASSSNYIGDLTTLSKHIAGHSYYSNGTTSNSLNQRISLKAKLAGKGLDYWQTEYSLIGGTYQQGRKKSELKEIDYALWLSRIIHTDLVFGDATGWSFWTALNQSAYDDHPFRFDLILYTPNTPNASNTDGTYKDNKLLWALGNFSRFVRPGMVRFQINDPEYDDSTSVENFMISGYKDATSKKIVLVCINNTDNARSISFEGYNADFKVAGDTFEMYTTSSTSDLKKSTVSFDEISIPNKSIVTLTATLQ